MTNDTMTALTCMYTDILRIVARAVLDNGFKSLRKAEVDAFDKAFDWLTLTYTDDSFGTMMSVGKAWERIKKGGDVDVAQWREVIITFTDRLNGWG